MTKENKQTGYYKPKYVIVSPVRNEEQFIEKTIKSVISQTVKPVEWIIVNDGSIDGTKQIIEKFVTKYNWIKIINKKDIGYDKLGSGVVEAFYVGYNQIANKDFDFIVKLDGDLSFESSYFEELLKRFAKNPKLGIAGGFGYYPEKAKLILEKMPKFHVHGPTKVYRRKCWEGIGGLISQLNWDAVDELKAQMTGWETKSFEELKFIHYRKTGSKDGLIKGYFRHGHGAFLIGYHPLFMLLRGVYRMIHKPYIIGGLAMIWGYVSSYLRRMKQIDDPELIQYLRRQQINKLLFRKTIWK